MDTFLEELFDSLASILPADWGRVTVHTAVGTGSEAVVLYVKGQTGERSYSHGELAEMGFFTVQELQSVCARVGRLSREYRKTFAKPWTGYTAVIGRDGEAQAELEYDPQPLSLSDAWKRRYLS